MKVSPISLQVRQNTFKAQKIETPKQQAPEKKEEITYGTWGPNYVYPIIKERNTDIFANNEKLNKKIEDKKELNPDTTLVEEETPEEYYRRKLYSTEWTM